MTDCQGSKVFVGPEAWVEFERLISTLANSGKKIFVLADENTAQFCVQKLEEKFGVFSENLLVVEAGESSKCLDIAHHLWMEMLESGADRHSVVFNIGGGVVTDLGAFVASTFKRGIPFVNVPTSLMGMADAAIGGKCGIDLGNAKNQIGTFTWPTSTLIMPEFLETLPDLEVKSGFVECIKHGLLNGRELWNLIVHMEPQDMTAEILIEIIKVKIDVVNEDPKEMGRRKSLNLGHTIGHAIESEAMESGNPLPHGHAIMLGLLAELKISEAQLALAPNILPYLEAIADKHFAMLRSHAWQIDSVVQYMKLDKKNEGDKLRFSLLSDLGRSKVDVNVPNEVIRLGIDHIKTWQNRSR